MEEIFYERILTGAKKLGNHFRKYLRNIERNYDLLIGTLEELKLSDRIDLWRVFDEPEVSMELLKKLSKEPQEQLKIVGCYYALQYVLININYLDILKLKLASEEDRIGVFEKYFTGVGSAFERLSRAYLKTLIDIIIGKKEDIPKFVLFSVGSPYDQDDIDLGIVDDGTGSRDEFNRLFSRIISEMLKNATPLHLYLSESLGSRFYTATIQEYTNYTEKITDNFVLISELLNAKLIAGDGKLFHEFYKKIIDRYYYKTWGEEKYHEAFIRGILGEIKHLLLSQLDSHKLNPKDDALRLIKGTLSAYKTIYNIKLTYFNEIIEKLGKKFPQKGELFKDLNRSLTFIETVRYIYQVLFIQSEEIDLTISPDMLNEVATTMGYKEVGALSPGTQLLIDYYKYVDIARKRVDQLASTVEGHIRSISVFSKMFKENINADSQAFSLDFIKEANFFKRVRYWDDVLIELSKNNHFYLKKIVKGLTDLKDKTYRKTLKKYIKWGKSSVFLLINLLINLERIKKSPASKLKDDIITYIYNNREKFFDFTGGFLDLFLKRPELFQTFMETLTREQTSKLKEILNEAHIYNQELLTKLDHLKYVINIYLHTSNFFKRLFNNVVRKHPEYMVNFHNSEFLKDISQGLLGVIPSVPGIKQKIAALKDYYNLEYLRIGLSFLTDKNVPKANEEFTEFCDYFFTYLYGVSKLYINRTLLKEITIKNKVAFLLTGGRGRREAFNEDYDLIFISEELSKEENEFITSVVKLMTKEVQKLGTFLHYRFADRFKTFVTPINKIKEYFLYSNDENVFIDMCQILSSRIISSSTSFVEKIKKELIENIIFKRRTFLIENLTKELKERREFANSLNSLSNMIDIKESPGGLREIELLRYIFRVYYKLDFSTDIDFFDKLKEIASNDILPYIEKLNDIYFYFKKICYLNRILVAQNHSVSVDGLSFIVPYLDYKTSPTMLYEELKEKLRMSEDLIDFTVNLILNKL